MQGLELRWRLNEYNDSSSSRTAGDSRSVSVSGEFIRENLSGTDSKHKAICRLH